MKPSSEIDPIAYWTDRAQIQGSAAVMWYENARLRALAHRTQARLIERLLPPVQRRQRALDVACGIGRMEPLLSGHFDQVTAFDLPAMIAQAQTQNAKPNIEYTAATIADFDYGEQRYDFVLMLGALVAACRVNQLPQIFGRVRRGMKPGGRLLLLEPFHSTPPLARYCRCHATTVVDIVTDAGFHPVCHSGAHLASLRLFLTKPGRLRSWLTPVLYPLGEALLACTSPRRFGDYQVLAFDLPFPVAPFFHYPVTPTDRHTKIAEIQRRATPLRIREASPPTDAAGPAAAPRPPLTLVLNDLGLVRFSQLPPAEAANYGVPGRTPDLRAWELIDKNKLLRLAQRKFPAALLQERVATTVVFDHDVGLPALQAAFPPDARIILKPATKDENDTFVRRYGAKVVRADGPAWAYELAGRMLTGGFPTVLQEELSIQNQRSVWFFRQGSDFRGLVSRTCGMYPTLGGTAYWTRVIRDDPLLQLGSEISGLLEFDGFGELEFQQSASGPYKWNLELNPRCWRQWLCALDAGLPLLDLLLHAHHGYPLPPPCKIRAGVGWFSVADLEAALREEPSWRRRFAIFFRLLCEPGTKEWHSRQSLLRILFTRRTLKTAATIARQRARRLLRRLTG